MRQDRLLQLEKVCERNVFPLVRILNQKGFYTYSCCEGHHAYTGQMIDSGFMGSKSDNLYAQEPLFSIPFVAFTTRIGDLNARTNRAIVKAIPDLFRNLQHYNQTAKIPWTLYPSGWGDGVIDTLVPDIERADGYEDYDFAKGDYEDLVRMWHEIRTLSEYFRANLKSII